MNNWNFSYLGKIDVGEIQKIILNNNLNWDEYTYRQDTHDVHKETKTIPIIFNENLLGEEKRHHNYNIFYNEINKISLCLSKIKNKKIIVKRFILINLPAGKKINNHIDNGKAFESTDRIHIPIFTNKNCFFTVGSEKINMGVGEVWQINNSGKMHKVENNGIHDRIHLLVDIDYE